MSQSSPQDSFTDKKNIMWVLLSGAMAITFVVLMFLPNSGLGGETLSVYSAMLWCGLFCAALFRYLNRNGWIGFAVGSVVGLGLQILSQLF